jgi:hypothetical protein
MTTYTVTATATDATTDTITVSSATNMFSGLPIVFSGSVFGGITAGATYYIGTVVPGFPSSTITVTSLPGGAVFALSTAAGTMTGTFSSGGQQIIDIGSVPNDGTGDPLRTAFNDTNVNFDQIFAAGPVGSNVQIANNSIITTNTNGNLVLAPNGTGTVQSNVSILPNQANVRNLGSASQRWSTIYAQYLDVSANLNIAGNIVYNGDLNVSGNLTVQGNIIQVGNIVTETLTIQLANAASTANAANGSGITVGANDDIATLLYNSTGNVWTTNIGLSSVGNITAPYFFGNGSQLTGLAATYGNANVVANLAALGSNPISTTGNITGGYLFGNGSQLTGLPVTYGNANAVAYGESGWAGNIVPSGNAVYSLGNATNQWNDLYVSNATIFMNNVPVSLSAGNVLTVNGNAVLTNGSNTAVSTTGNITAGNIGITGGSLTWANASIVQTSASDVSITGDGQVTVRSLDGTYQWTFESTGNLTLPGATAGETIATQGGYITVGNLLVGQSGALFNSNNDSWALYGNLSDPGATIFIPSNADAGNGTALYIESQQSNVEIRSGSSTWNFDNTGNLALPRGGIVYETNIPDGGLDGNTIALKPSGGTNADQQLLVYPTTTDANHLHLTSGNLYNTELFLGDDNLYVKLANTGNVVVNSNDDTGNTAQWTFGANGNLTLPGNTIAINYLNGNLAFGTVTFNNEAVIGTGTSNTVSGLYLAPDPVSLANDLYLRVRGNIQDEPTHIHFDTGNNQYYNQFIGDDNKYIQLANTGNIVINASDYAANTAQWTFGTDSALTLPASSGQIGRSGYPNGIDLYNNNGGTGYVRMNYADESLISADSGGAHVQTAGGTWDFDTTGNLTAPGNVSAVGNIIGGNIVTSGNITTTGSGGDITMSGGNITGAGNISAGNLIATGNIVLTGSLVGSGASPAPSINGFSSVSAVTLSASGNVTAGNVNTGVITLTNGAVIKDNAGDSVAFGQSAGGTSQGNSAVALGQNAGATGQGTFTVAIGRNAGQTTQGGAAVAIGVSAGDTSQGNSAVAIGSSAGFTNQSANTVAVGVGAGQSSQGVDAVAIGASAGSLTQGIAAVAIGTLAGRTFQANNSIIINATGANLDQTTANTFTVAPVRNDNSNIAEVMFYNTTSKEITYGNVISVAGNITGGNLTVGSGTITGGNVNGANFNGNVAFGTGTVGGSGNITGGNISAIGNISGGNLSLSGNITSDIGFTGATITINNAPGGNEGAEVIWALPSPANTVLSTSLVQDVYQNGMRFFESGGNSRGLYMDLGSVPNGSATAVGYRDIPQVAFTANTTIATTDAGRHYYSTQSTSYILTIANNASQGFQVGAAISIVNQGTGNITVAQGSGVTLYLAGNATSGNRTVATFGMATLIKVATDTWFINGTGIS